MDKVKTKKIIAIVGTTASGKTNLAVGLALLFNGEVISADSRQVYRYMDIGSGKDLGEYSVNIKGENINIPYHLIDVSHPNDKYDLAKWLSGAKIAVDDISSRQKLPIVAGGTGLYTQALLDGYKLCEQSSDLQLREELGKYDIDKLISILNGLNNKFVQTLNESEIANKRRLIRHIEILTNTKEHGLNKEKKSRIRPFNDLIIGLSWPRDILRDRIYNRIVNRIENEGMIEEVKTLNSEQGVDWARLESFGLEYKYLSYYLQNKMDYNDMINKLHIATCQFAKRQMTWLRRWEKQGAKINWVSGQDEAENIVKNFLDG